MNVIFCSLHLYFFTKANLEDALVALSHNSYKLYKIKTHILTKESWSKVHKVSFPYLTT
jgi:hypothetical protein